MADDADDASEMSSPEDLPASGPPATRVGQFAVSRGRLLGTLGTSVLVESIDLDQLSCPDLPALVGSSRFDLEAVAPRIFVWAGRRRAGRSKRPCTWLRARRACERAARTAQNNHDALAYLLVDVAGKVKMSRVLQKCADYSNEEEADTNKMCRPRVALYTGGPTLGGRSGGTVTGNQRADVDTGYGHRRVSTSGNCEPGDDRGRQLRLPDGEREATLARVRVGGQGGDHRDTGGGREQQLEASRQGKWSGIVQIARHPAIRGEARGTENEPHRFERN